MVHPLNPKVTRLARCFAGFAVGLSVLAACSSGSTPQDDESSSSSSSLGGDELDIKQERYRECLADRGFPSESVPSASGGLWRAPIAEDQAEAFRLASEECLIESGLLTGEPIQPPSSEYLSAYYDFLLELAQCVEAQGYPVRDPPSRETFIESEGAIWHPYEQVGASEEDFLQLEEACPQTPAQPLG
jgi:hypothetical protein